MLGPTRVIGSKFRLAGRSVLGNIRKRNRFQHSLMVIIQGSEEHNQIFLSIQCEHVQQLRLSQVTIHFMYEFSSGDSVVVSEPQNTLDHGYCDS